MPWVEAAKLTRNLNGLCRENIYYSVAAEVPTTLEMIMFPILMNMEDTVQKY